MPITASTLPRQVYSHKLDPVKGWFDMAALDFSAKLSGNVSFAPVYAGRCVHLNDAGEFETGCTGWQMPIFLLKNSDDPSTGGAFGGGGGQTMTGWVAVMPRSKLTGLVGKGAYELETTEFDVNQTYLPNQPLRAIADNADITLGGTLTNQGVVYMTNTPAAWTAVVGTVSKPPYRRQSDRPTVLGFWPGHFPGAAGL